MELFDAKHKGVEHFFAIWNRALPFRFLIVGGWNFAFSYIFFAVTYWLLIPVVHDAVILALCLVVGITNAFLSHRFLTYRSRGSIWGEYFRFYLVYGVQTGLNFILFLLFVRVFKSNPYFTQALLTFALTIVSYWGHKHVSFKSRKQEIL